MSLLTADKLADEIAEVSGTDRRVCKEVIYCLLCQGPLVPLCIRRGLTVGKVTDIRQAFDKAILREVLRQGGTIR
jgi:hypothetical protein